MSSLDSLILASQDDVYAQIEADICSMLAAGALLEDFHLQNCSFNPCHTYLMYCGEIFRGYEIVYKTE
jgi:hypothetical protein